MMLPEPQTTSTDPLDELGLALETKALEQVALKREIEDRWIEDVRQYNGRYDARTETELDRDKTGASKIFVNLTRSKTTAAEARVADMLFPADDRNWAIQPTPIPELHDPVMRQMAEEQFQIADELAKNMERQIEDQLTEADYHVTARDVIHDAAVLGTGILKGPVIIAKERRSWLQVAPGVHEIQFVNEHRPSVERVSPWDFFPDMSALHWREVEFSFERRYLTRKQLRKLMERPGYREEAIQRVLHTDPREHRSASDYYLQQLREITGITQVTDDNRFELWEYHGPVSRDDLLASGMDTENDEQEGIVVFCNGIVIKDIVPNPLDTEDSAYSIFCWEDDDATVFGFGVPYLMRSPQKVINAAWRMMLTNSALAVGPQIVIDTSMIQPADGQWALSPRKLWLKSDPTRTVNEAFGAFKVDSYQPELMAIFEKGKELADQETSLPMLTQGELGETPDQTATGMSMLMNAANVVLRRVVKRWDDDITKPLITRFYDYNMQYGDDPSIKGDFEVAPRGSSALMVKETQVQSLSAMMQFAATEAYGPLTDMRELYRAFVEANRLDPDKIVRKDDPPPQPDPQIVKAQMDAQTEQARLAQQQQQAQAELALEQQRSQAELMQALEIERAKLDNDYRMHREKLAQERELKTLELQSKEAQTALGISSKQEEARMNRERTNED